MVNIGGNIQKMSIKHDLFQLCKPYYLFNIFISLSYIVLKRLPGVCNYVFSTDNCEFDGRESEILFFLIIVIAMRTRKTGSISMLSYMSSSFLYTKIANLILWFTADPLLGIIYGIIFILGALILPQPTYSGPDKVIYFGGIKDLEEELSRDTKVTWLITFYAVWNPTCASFAPIFAKISSDYHLDNFKFGKIDVGRYPEAAKKFHIDDSSFSKQLPTIILFQEGKEVMRRPIPDTKGKYVKFLFSDENVRRVFGLNICYEQCKNKLQSTKISKKHTD